MARKKLPKIPMTLENEVIISVVVFYVALSAVLLTIHHWPYPASQLAPASPPAAAPATP